MASRPHLARTGAVLGASVVLLVTALPADAAGPHTTMPRSTSVMITTADVDAHAPAVLSIVLSAAGSAFLLVQRRRKRA
jgi:hypothetical protein